MESGWVGRDLSHEGQENEQPTILAKQVGPSGPTRGPGEVILERAVAGSRPGRAVLQRAVVNGVRWLPLVCWLVREARVQRTCDENADAARHMVKKLRAKL